MAMTRTLTEAQLEIIKDALICGARDLKDAAEDLKSHALEDGIAKKLMENFTYRMSQMNNLYDELV
jgi:hypothetical protein